MTMLSKFAVGAVLIWAAPLQAETLATAEGPNGLVFELIDLAIDEGAVTLTGRIVNNGDGAAGFTGKMNSPEIEASDSRHNTSSVSGIYVIDKAAGKKASPLFTTEGECICTNNLGAISSGDSFPIFASFPKPNDGAEKLDVVVPMFLPMNGVSISGAGAATDVEPKADESSSKDI